MAICRAQIEKEKTPEEPPITGATEGEAEGEDEPVKAVKTKDRIHIQFKVPKGKVSSLMGIMNLLQSKFENLEIEIDATEGEITEQDYEAKIKEAFRQIGIKLE